MKVRIHSAWQRALQPEFDQPYFQELARFVKQSYTTKTIYPKPGLIFNAFNSCPKDRVRVVILGQDPYHGPDQAHGLSFSVPDSIKPPPSLINIFKEIHTDLGKTIPHSGNLTRWAQQGILLLNATLTVEAHKAGSHQKKGWEQFTDSVVAHLNQHQDELVFMLWGRYAQQKGQIIDHTRHLVLEAAHPSPLSAHNGFFGCRHFSQTNAYLMLHGKDSIDW